MGAATKDWNVQRITHDEETPLRLVIIAEEGVQGVDFRLETLYHPDDMVRAQVYDPASLEKLAKGLLDAAARMREAAR